MREEWRAVPGYAYEVSNLGRVRSVDRQVRFLSKRGREFFRPVRGTPTSTQIQNGGYVIVHLYRDNLRKAFTVHRLVAEAFLWPTPPGLDVNHKDGNRQNNRVDNLEWMTRSENLRHGVARRRAA